MRSCKNIALLGLLSMILVSRSSSQSLPVFDNFPYAAGDLTTASGTKWSFALGSQDFTVIDSDNLTKSGYASDNDGTNSLVISSLKSSAVKMGFDAVSTVNTALYYSFLLNVSASPSSPTATSFIVGFAETSVSTIFGSVYVKHKDASNFNIGISRREDLPVTYFSTDLAYNTTHLVVLKYKFISGVSNDEASLIVNPTLPGAEPSASVADIANIGSGTPDPGDLAWAIINQESDAVDAKIDAIRVGTSWDDAPLPVQLANFAATSSRSGVELRWSTATELNNYGFEIERRSVGAEEQEGWARAGFVQGAGTTTDPREYSFVDSDLWPGRYGYRIKQIDFSGAVTYYQSAEVEVGLAPKELALEPNYPNPFNPTTNISFTVPDDGRAILRVYNMLGQEVAVLFEGEAVAGRLYRATFDASALPTGVYVSRLESGGQSVMRKMLFVK